MYVVVKHTINNPDHFWSAVREATPNIPDDFKIHHCLPNAEGQKAVCVWEGPSLERVREIVESAVGQASNNEYFEAVEKEGVHVPPAFTE